MPISCISLCLLLEVCNGDFDNGQPIKYSLADLLLRLPSTPECLDYDKLVKTIMNIHDSIEGRKGLVFREDAVASPQKRLEAMHGGCNKERLPEELRDKTKVTPETCADDTENYKKIYNENIVNQIMRAYDVKDIKYVAETIKNYIISVRQGKLYKQIARFVGRVNCDQYNTGTGIVIGWKDMPASLKGRVVLTAAHNYTPFYLGTDRSDKDYDHKIAPNDVYQCTLKRTLTDGDEMSFMLDLNDANLNTSDDKKILEDATALPPGFGRGNASNRKEVDVECVYVPLQEENASRLVFYSGMADIAICILKDTVDNEFLDIDDCIEYVKTDASHSNLEDGSDKKEQSKPEPSHFAICYGMAGSLSQFDYFTKFITGWNLKKRTYDFSVSVDDDKPSNVCIDPMPLMPSNSGGPVVRKDTDGNYKICALCNGVCNTRLTPFVEWIKKVVNQHNAEEQSKKMKSKQCVLL